MVDLKQYTQQKRRNPIILVFFILFVVLIAVLIYNKRIATRKFDPGNLPVQIIITSALHHLSDTAFPVLLMKDNLLIQVFKSNIPRDTAFYSTLRQGKNIFNLLNKEYQIIASDSVLYKDEKVIFINLQTK
jgi:hypothetical protein